MSQIAIEPKSKADNDKMGAALYKLAQEDPSFHFSRDDETNQTVIEGMGELHLDIIVDRMKREFNVAADIGAPQVCHTTLSKLVSVGADHSALATLSQSITHLGCNCHCCSDPDCQPECCFGDTACVGMGVVNQFQFWGML